MVQANLFKKLCFLSEIGLYLTGDVTAWMVERITLITNLKALMLLKSLLRRGKVLGPTSEIATLIFPVSSCLTQERQLPQIQHLRENWRVLSCSFVFLSPWNWKFVFLEIDPDFTEQLKSLVPLILSPENLVVKQIDGKEITAKELAYYFELYTTLFNGDKLPKPRSVLEVLLLNNNSQNPLFKVFSLFFQATAEANNLSGIKGKMKSDWF